MGGRWDGRHDWPFTALQRPHTMRHGRVNSSARSRLHRQHRGWSSNRASRPYGSGELITARPAERLNLPERLRVLPTGDRMVTLVAWCGRWRGDMLWGGDVEQGEPCGFTCGHRRVNRSDRGRQPGTRRVVAERGVADCHACTHAAKSTAINGRSSLSYPIGYTPEVSITHANVTPEIVCARIAPSDARTVSAFARAVG